MIEPHPPGSRDPSGRGRPSLLIADDDPVVVSMLSAQLAGSFDVVAGARDADEAIARAVEHEPDAAILDIQMPGGGGVRAARELSVQTPATAIVILSADETDAMVRGVIAAGAVTYVRKGLPGHELARKLHQSIEAHAQLRERPAAAAPEPQAAGGPRTSRA